MKAIVLALSILCITTVDAQLYKNLRASQDYYNNVFSSYESDFNIDAAPEKYKDEPAVILVEKTHISLLSRKLGQVCKGIVRKRILIQHSSELETFTEYYYQSSDIVGIKHVKPDGTINEIDLEDAIKVESEVPAYYRNGFHREVYYKIAIPNLEVGDIIDSYKVFAEYYTEGVIELMTTISNEYPIAHQEIIVDVDDKWTMHKRAFNTNSDFKLAREGGVDKKGNQSKKVKRYILEETDIPASKYERWAYPFMTSPAIKLMASTKLSGYFDKDNKNKSQLDITEEFKGAMKTNSQYIGNFYPLLKSYYKPAIRKKSDSEVPDIVYNALKYYNAMSLGTTTTGAARVQQGDLHYLSHQYSSINDAWFSAMFSHILKKEGIPSEIVMVVPEYLGGTEYAVVGSEIEYGVYVPANGKYYWTVDSYRVPGDEYSKVMGGSGYQMPYEDKNTHNPRRQAITIPYSTPEKNINESNIDITVNDDNSLKFSKNLKLTGLYKREYSSILLYHTFYTKDNVLQFSSNEEANRILDYEVNGFTKKSARKMKTSLEELSKEVDEHYDIRDKNIDEWIKSDFRVDEILDFETKSFGSTLEDNALEAEMIFTSKDYIKKAGPNLVFDLGALITDQVELSDKEINEREQDAYINYEKTISNNIIITLPDGLTAHGLEALQFDIDNEYGTFKSTVTQTGNMLKLATTKIYKKTHIPVDDWKKMTDMLEAAYQFTQQKVILKK